MRTAACPAPILSVQAAGRWAGERWIWRGVSFDVQPGDRLGVVGPSGAGKTLLLRALAGLDPLDEGTVLYQGGAPDDGAMPAYRSHVLYLAQTPALLEGTVEDNLRAVFAFHVHRAKTFDVHRIRHDLVLLKRDAAFLQRPVHVLSGGERQIVAFLRALQLGPDVLLLDEPTANLDAENARQIERLVAAWLAETDGRAALWSSHQPDQLGRVTTRRIDLTRFTHDAG